MKIVNLKLLVFIAILLPGAVNANFSKAQEKELERKIFKTEQHLKQVLTRDLELSVGVKEILIDVDLDVDQAGVYKEVASVDETWKKIENLELPSLFIDKNRQRDLKEVKSIEIEHILSHIKKIGLKLSTPYDIVDKDAMNENLKRVLASNYNKAASIKLEIKYYKTKELLVDNRTKGLSTPQYMNVINDFKKLGPYFIGVLSFVFLSGLIFLGTFRKSMSKMISAIDDIEISNNTLPQSPALNETFENKLIEQEQQSRGMTKNSEKSIGSYIELIEKIKYVVSKDKTLLFEMIDLHFKVGEVSKILVLLNIIENEEREKLYNDIPANHLKDLQNFVINEGENLYKDEHKLNEIAQEIFRVVSVAMIKPESFYQIYLKKIISSLSAVEVANVIHACTQRELMYFMENVDGVKLAFVCSTNDFSSIEFHSEKVELSTDEVKTFVQKLAKFIYVKDSMVDGNANAKIIPHLSSELEEKYIESMGISKDLSFKNLTTEYEKFTEDYIKTLNFEDINAILGLFSQEQQQYYIGKLPDLVGERLRSRAFSLSERTFKLKINLYEELKENHQKKMKEKVNLVNEQLNYLDKTTQKLEDNSEFSGDLSLQKKENVEDEVA